MSQASLKLPEECYNELEQLVKEISKDKEGRGVNPKTTYGEVICLLICEHRERKEGSIPVGSGE